MKVLGLILAGSKLGCCATSRYGSPQATADLKNAAGDTVGTARF